MAKGYLDWVSRDPVTHGLFGGRSTQISLLQSYVMKKTDEEEPLSGTLGKEQTGFTAQNTFMGRKKMVVAFRLSWR